MFKQHLRRKLKRSVCAILLAAFLPHAHVHAAESGSAGSDFRLPTLGGDGELTLQDLRGKVVYLDFWASWCGPCRKSLPLYESLYQEIGSQQFAIVAINLDETREDAVRFLKQHPVSYTILLDPVGSTAADWQIRVMPTSFLLDRSGMIVREYAGFEPAHIEDIRHDIDTLLDQ
ncbi:MAG TPA: TlpA disulfide reductase family protein [Xanthomonadales bacterium]|nr:TlpA disulfide reductase family protein [Xanthomonadales bacterium]